MIDNHIPSMYHWSVLKQFVVFKNNAYKVDKCNLGEMHCFGCKLNKKCHKGEVLVEKVNDVLSKIVGFCEICGTKMNIRIGAAKIYSTIQNWNYKIVQQLDVDTLIFSSNPSSRNMLREKKKFELVNPLQISPINERMKHEYFSKIKEIRGYDYKTKILVISALEKFERFTEYKGFKLFNYEIAVNFKNYTRENNKT